LCELINKRFLYILIFQSDASMQMKEARGPLETRHHGYQSIKRSIPLRSSLIDLPFFPVFGRQLAILSWELQ
jgi:hypothetical protein